MKLIVSLILIGFLAIMVSYADEGHHHTAGEERKAQALGICPVMHEPALEEYSYTYEGKTYYFCCPVCIEKFKAEPQKYISKIKELTLEAYQFGFSPDPLKVKKDDIVKLTLISRDVPHGVYIKEYAIKVTVQIGETKKIEFFADKVGEFEIICSVYCGPGHSTMKGKLIVEK